MSRLLRFRVAVDAETQLMRVAERTLNVVEYLLNSVRLLDETRVERKLRRLGVSLEKRYWSFSGSQAFPAVRSLSSVGPFELRFP